MNNLLEKRIEAGDFIITAEYLPGTNFENPPLPHLKNKSIVAVNVADNPYGPVMSSLSTSIHLQKAEVEPIYQLVTRDRNRIALQSDVLGAASSGIKNILCLSGYHQTLTDQPESAHVYDIDSIQLINTIRQMNVDGVLLNGTKINNLSILIGAVANPYLRPLELNIIRLVKKVNAGARFIQTQAVFNTTDFQEWMDAANNEGITKKAAIIAGIFPIESYDEALQLIEKHTDFYIPDSHLKRMKDAGDKNAQKKMGITICAETIKKIKGIKGVSGIHIISGGKENVINEIIAEAGL